MQYIVEKIKNALYAGLSKKCSYIYVGDPTELPLEVLEKGCIVIQPGTQDIELKETQRDEDSLELAITVMKDMRSEIGKKPQTVGSLQWIMDIVDGRDGNGALKTSTVRYIMRQQLNEIGVTHTLRIEYGKADREEATVRVAVITVNVTDFVNRPQ